jgi:hypothetical protein
MGLRRTRRISADDNWARNIEKQIPSQVAIITINVGTSTFRMGVKHTPREPNGMITKKAKIRLKMVDPEAQLGRVVLEQKFVLLEFDDWTIERTKQKVLTLEALKRAQKWMRPPEDHELDAEYTEDVEWIASVIGGLTNKKGEQKT